MPIFSFLGVFGDVIFVADAYYDAIYASPLTSSDTSLFRLPIENLTLPVGIDFDPFDNRIYWADYSRGTIMRSTVYGNDQESIRPGAGRPFGLALDLVARNIYWINRQALTIEVSKLNGANWKVLVSNLYSSAYDIALDTRRGYEVTHYT